MEPVGENEQKGKGIIMADLMNVTQTLSSMEVAEMVEKEHRELLKAIRRYTSQLGEGKISPADFWSDSTYEDSQGKQRPCYLITKLGCEFIAHKTTGAKGTAFTAKYIVRFHQMEEALKQGISSPELPADEKLYLAKYNKTWYDTHKWKMDKLCYDYGWERKYLYHKILKEVADIWNLDYFRELYYNRKGKEAAYDMNIINEFPALQEVATRYLDFLLDAND